MTLRGTIFNRISDGRAIVAVAQPFKGAGGSSGEGRATGTSRIAVFSMWLTWWAPFLSGWDDELCNKVWWRFPHSGFWQRTENLNDLEECLTELMQWKWRNDRRSERNLCNCVKKPEKNSGLQRGLNPWPRNYRCNALPTELWSHWRWEQINCGFICSNTHFVDGNIWTHNWPAVIVSCGNHCEKVFTCRQRGRWMTPNVGRASWGWSTRIVLTSGVKHRSWLVWSYHGLGTINTSCNRGVRNLRSLWRHGRSVYKWRHARSRERKSRRRNWNGVCRRRRGKRNSHGHNWASLNMCGGHKRERPWREVVRLWCQGLGRKEWCRQSRTPVTTRANER